MQLPEEPDAEPIEPIEPDEPEVRYLTLEELGTLRELAEADEPWDLYDDESADKPFAPYTEPEPEPMPEEAQDTGGARTVAPYSRLATGLAYASVLVLSLLGGAAKLGDLHLPW
jgi:hypothetical protein